MSGHIIEDTEEGLVGIGAFFPGGLIVGFVPGGLDFDWRIVIGLGAVGGIISGLAKQFREADHPGRNFALGAHVLGRAAGDRISTGDEREARGGANRPREATFVEHAFVGQSVERGSVSQLVAVTTKETVIVLADDPENIRMLRCGREGARDGKEEAENKGG